MQPPTETAADLDSFLAGFLEDDFLSLMLAPPPVPSFAALTVRPGAPS